MRVIDWKDIKEVKDQPKMLEVYLEQSYQDAFCYALACEQPEKEWQYPKLLLAIISGSDSTLQSMKAAVDIGSMGLHFGYGEKELTGYSFKKEFQIESEKGKYEKFPMTINSNRKAIAIVHDSLLGNDDFVLSFNGNPAEDIRQLLGGGKYGLHILPEWKDIIFHTLLKRGYVEELDFYYDKYLFENDFGIYKLNLEEEQADSLISELIKNKELLFPGEGTGESLEEITDLTNYMTSYVESMVNKLSDEVTPTHNPMEEEAYTHFNSYNRELFPVQAHVATAAAKRLKEQKSLIIQGEMSTGKTTMLVALADAYFKEKNKKGFFACVMVPPSLTKKWPEEIKEIIPDADVHVISESKKLIEYHTEWTNKGRPKPSRPTFFVISFTTMRGDSAIVPAVSFIRHKTRKQLEEGMSPYKYGFYCPDCGKAHQVIENTSTQLNEKGEEVTVHSKRTMGADEFGDGRRLNNAQKPANAFCSECGGSLWTKKVPTRYQGFSEWTKHENKVTHAALQGNKKFIDHLQVSQKDIPKVVGRPRKVAASEYIRRKMNNFFDIALIDEIHELKSGMSAQGMSLANLVSTSKKAVGATGTLFGGKAEDVYFLLWRLFPHLMVENGFKFSEVRKWNEDYGNIETTIIEQGDDEYTNKQSRGGTKRTEKILPGISPFVFGKFLVQNAILVRLIDVWPDPVEFVNVPTILVPMDNELRKRYDDMVFEFERQIDSRSDGHKLYLPLTSTGIAYPDNPFTYPEVRMLNEEGEREVIWSPDHLSNDITLNKEKKLQEIIKGEMSEGRKSIVYCRDTGSTVEGRDVRPRLQKVLEEIGAKVAILDTSSTKTNSRSEWVRKKIEKEGYDVIIVSQELVKVGIDLLCTPTLIFYQFSWSLFTINQAARRSWRIGQTFECRLFYLAYEECYQEQMAQLIAMKNKAASAINGDVSSDGLSAMLGDQGDLQSMLIESIKKGTTLKGSTEEWVAESSDRAREILAGVGKSRKATLLEQYKKWVHQTIQTQSTVNVLLKKSESILKNIKNGKVTGFSTNQGSLEIDLVEAFGFDMVEDGAILSYLTESERKHAPSSPYDVDIFEIKVDEQPKKKRKKSPADGQLAFSLFE